MMEMTPLAITASSMIGKCFSCVAEHKMFVIKKENGTLQGDITEPMIREADTWAPSWQQVQVGMQNVMACVPLPTCSDHLAVNELSPLDQAIRGGRVLPGGLG